VTFWEGFEIGLKVIDFFEAGEGYWKAVSRLKQARKLDKSLITSKKTFTAAIFKNIIHKPPQLSSFH
jgi:hypothetical protein